MAGQGRQARLQLRAEEFCKQAVVTAPMKTKKKKAELVPTEREFGRDLAPDFEHFWNKRRADRDDSQNKKHAKKSKEELEAIGLSQYIREQPDWEQNRKDEAMVSKWVSEFREMHHGPEPELSDSESEDEVEGEENRLGVLNRLGAIEALGSLEAGERLGDESFWETEEEDSSSDDDGAGEWYLDWRQNERAKELQDLLGPVTIKESTVQYVLAELTYYLSIKEGSMEVGFVDGTWQSDALIPHSLRDDLLANLALLEESVSDNKDWNDVNQVVWNLISPSMYCLVGERSRILKEPYWPTEEEEANQEGRSGLIHYHRDDALLSIHDSDDLAFPKKPKVHGYNSNMSDNYQWLPSEFQIDPNNSVTIASYINNLHPEQHSGLYSVIEAVFEKFVPLFNKVLTDLMVPRVRWEDLDQGRKFAAPKITKEQMYSLAGRKVQVITKFTNIQLTPEKPKYTGGSFHSEGLPNEMIVATGIYYHSCENVTESRLEFQRANSGMFPFRHQPTEVEFDNVGSIITKQGRCIAFPNNLQHRVKPFKLEDPSRPGHRKILVFFLVDPSVRVISTAYVPPQQKSWFVKEILKGPVCLPEEIIDLIVDKLEGPMNVKEAREHRDGIIRERRDFDVTYGDFLQRRHYKCHD